MSEILTVGGVVYVGRPDSKRRSTLHVGKHVGWFPAQGIRTWTKEASVVKKSDLTPALLSELGAKLPEDVARAAKSNDAANAAAAASLVAIEPELVKKLVAKGVRVYSIGCDRTTGGIHFFAEGGNEPEVRLQGDLVSMVAPTLPDTASNADIDDAAETVIDRLLSELTGGALSELEVELAEALPKLGEADPRETLQTFEGYMLLGKARSDKYAKQANAIASALDAAQKAGQASTAVDLFDEATLETQEAITLVLNASGEDREIKLPARNRWITTREMAPSILPPPVKPVDDTKKKAEEEAAAAAAKKKAEEAAAKKAEEEAAAARKKAEEAAAAKKAEEEAAAAAAKKKAEEEAAAAKKAEEEAAAAKKAEEEAEAAAKKAEEEAAAAKKAEEEAAVAAKKAEEEAAAAKKKAEEPAAEKKPSAKTDEPAKAVETKSAKVDDKPVVAAKDTDKLEVPTTKIHPAYLAVAVGVVLLIIYLLTRS